MPLNVPFTVHNAIQLPKRTHSKKGQIRQIEKKGESTEQCQFLGNAIGPKRPCTITSAQEQERKRTKMEMKLLPVMQLFEKSRTRQAYDYLHE